MIPACVMRSAQNPTVAVDKVRSLIPIPHIFAFTMNLNPNINESLNIHFEPKWQTCGDLSIMASWDVFLGGGGGPKCVLKLSVVCEGNGNGTGILSSAISWIFFF